MGALTRRGLLMVAATILACGSPTDPGALAPSLDIQKIPGNPARPLTLTVSDGTITLSGDVGSPTPCYNFEATARHHGGTLLVVLTAIDQQVICVDMLQAWEYQLVVKAIPPGQYNVVFSYATYAIPAGIRLTRTVEVP